jgi:hypothetical protein
MRREQLPRRGAADARVGTWGGGAEVARGSAHRSGAEGEVVDCTDEEADWVDALPNASRWGKEDCIRPEVKEERVAALPQEEERRAGFTLLVRSPEPPAGGFDKPTGKPRLPLKTEQIQISN